MIPSTFLSHLLCACMCECTLTRKHAWRGQRDNLQELALSFPTSGFWGLNSGHRACHQVPLPTELTLKCRSDKTGPNKLKGCTYYSRWQWPVSPCTSELRCPGVSWKLRRVPFQHPGGVSLTIQTRPRTSISPGTQLKVSFLGIWKLPGLMDFFTHQLRCLG